MKQGVKFFTLFCLLLVGCAKDTVSPWAYEYVEDQGELRVSYRCDHLALEPGDVFAIELDVLLPLVASEPDIHIGLDNFSIVEALTLPTELPQSGGLLRRYRWVVQAVAPLAGPSEEIEIRSVIDGEPLEINFTHAHLVVHSILKAGENPLKLPGLGSNAVEATP